MTRRLGTFTGVFTPTILTILGVIMYLRFGWLVGELGLGRVIPIVLLANAITLVTSLSFSAVATNKPIGGGGAYFIISRSLGMEAGGAIGVPLFLSQALSVTLYAYGLAESLRFVWPDLPLEQATFGVILAVGLLAWLGAEKALRAQLPLLILVAASLAALAVGALLRNTPAAGAVAGFAAGGGTAGPSGAVTFWKGFAVFFPAVTGVMAGLGLSGDLRDPMRSLPRGTFAAVLAGMAVYLMVPWLLARGASTAALRDDPLVWSQVAVGGAYLVLPGLWAAIFSSAVGSILGAPRTLQALARDGLMPRFLDRRGKDGDPDLLPALVVTLALALGAVLLGGLNTVAEVVSMFFLTVYGAVNVVAAFEALSGDPSWRPRLRSPWLLNLAGGLACLAVMVLINPVAGLIALAAELALYLGLTRREFSTGWGDARRGLYENLIRWALVQLDRHPMTPRSWRPHILVFVSDLGKEMNLVRLADWFCRHRGVVTVCKLLVDRSVDNPELIAQHDGMRAHLEAAGLVAFPEADLTYDLVEGIVNVAQANGMGGIASNTVLLGWPTEPGLQVEFLQALRKLELMNKSVILARVQDSLAARTAYTEPRIMVWWGGLQRNGDLMLLLTYLMTGNPTWRHARIRIMSLASTELMMRQTERNLHRLLGAIRIRAEVEVLLREPGVKVADVIRERSREAELVVMGLATPEPGHEAEYAARMEALTEGLPNVLFVKNATCFVGELVSLPDEEGNREAPASM